jgi:hypothetical protein
MTLKAARWFILAVGGTLVVLMVAAAAGSRTATLRRLVTEAMADRLDSEVELAVFSVDTFPTVTVRGEGLVVRHKGRRDVPPLISIRSFSVHGGMLGLLNRPRRFGSVQLTGLQISIPPGGIDNDPKPAAEAATGARRESPFVIDRLQADGAELRIIPKQAGKEPRVFAIHRLEMRSLGIAERMPFKAELTNPVPRGAIQTEGEFGPWARHDPGATALTGRYTFANADLSTIKGIAGILTSTGEFGGQLRRISVRGQTRTPDFRIDISGQPVPLETRFQAVVDGTDGDTYLNDVYATIQDTQLHATGAVTGTPGVKGRTVQLQVRIEDGRIEDLLRLSVKGEQPLMVGDVALRSEFTLPPGADDVVERLRLSGEFDVDARFTDPAVQSKLTGMSRRARGMEPTSGAGNVVSGLSGRFRMQDGVISFPTLGFSLPGATVSLRGTYGLQSEALEFDGTLRMQATLSEAAGGGIKSFLLKAVDPLFRKRNAGAVLPIKVRGTRSEPKVGLDVVKALTPK